MGCSGTPVQVPAVRRERSDACRWAAARPRRHLGHGSMHGLIPLGNLEARPGPTRRTPSRLFCCRSRKIVVAEAGERTLSGCQQRGSSCRLFFSHPLSLTAVPREEGVQPADEVGRGRRAGRPIHLASVGHSPPGAFEAQPHPVLSRSPRCAGIDKPVQ